MQGSSFIRSASEGTAKAQDNETREKGAVGLVPFFDGAHDKATAKSRDSPDREEVKPDASAGWRAEYAHQHVDSQMIEK